ncbi:MAG: ABC transporter permease [Bacteroidota bacterium]
MKYTSIIAKRILKGQKQRFAQLIIRISIASIAIGIAVMLISLTIVTGFQKTIRDKVSGFGAHITISRFDLNQSYESAPIALNQPYIKQIKENKDVISVQPFATKAGIIKQKDIIEGIVLKGVDSSYNWDFFKTNLKEGKILSFDSVTSKDIMVSKVTATKLAIKVGDKVSMYFIQDPPRMRAFTVCGIYETGLNQFDGKFAMVDINQIRKLNNWENNEVDGYEVIAKDFSKIDQLAEDINLLLPFDQKGQTIKESNPDLFDWIGLFDTNVYILIGLMILISTITVISTLLILILEQTNLIGILKAIGANNQSISSIFIKVAGRIIFIGMILGNLIALLISITQKYTHIIRLNQELYYMDAVPVNINPLHYIIVNIGVFVITSIFVLAPIYFVTRKISTIQAIRYQ